LSNGGNWSECNHWSRRPRHVTGRDGSATFIITTQEKIMKSLFALLACAGLVLTVTGCPQEADTTPAPDTTPELGEPTPLENTGSTTGAPDTSTTETSDSSTGTSDTGAAGETSDTGTEGTSTEGPALPDSGGTAP
jgi:hypothetical protein